MINIIDYWQTLPEKISPLALEWGGWSISWYALCYLLSFLIGGAYLWKKLDRQPFFQMKKSDLFDLCLIVFAGAILGGRLGYVLFYNPVFYWRYPLAIISPINSAGEWIGIYGLSYHGGLLGVILGALGYARSKGWSFWSLAEWAVPAVPLGYFWGRIGNFFNGELYGRITGQLWGMRFLDDNGEWLLRHPSQLYEALGEGLFLFVGLYYLDKKGYGRGLLFPIYLVGYALIRFFIEFFREPDAFLGFFWGQLTLGQYYCLLMLLIGMAIGIYRKRKIDYNIE